MLYISLSNLPSKGSRRRFITFFKRIYSKSVESGDIKIKKWDIQSLVGGGKE